MRRKLHQALRRWMDAENAADDGRAAEAFGDLYRALPAAAPPSGMARRILRAWARERRVRRAWKWSFVGASSVVAAAWVTAPGLVLNAVQSGRALDWLSGLLIGAGTRLADVMSAASAVSSVGQTLAGTLEAPTLIVASAGALLVSWGAFGVLVKLTDGEFFYVRSG